MLKDYIEETNERTVVNNQFPVLTASKNGVFLQDEYFNKQVASKENIGYKIVHKGDFTYRAMSDTGYFYPNRLDCAEIGIVSPAYPVFRITKSNLLDSSYLKYYFKSNRFQYSISKYVQGSTRTSVKYHQLASTDIDLPDLEEQRNVVSLLEKTERLIASYNKQLSLLNDLVKSRFVEMFEDEKIFMTMSELCSIITDGTHQPPKFVDAGIPFIFVSNISGNKITYDAEKYIDQSTYDDLIKRTPIEISDVLLSTVGSYGHPAVVKKDDKFLFQRHIAYLKPKKELVDSDYLHGAILSPDSQRQIEEGVKGIAQKTLNLSEIKRMRIPVPVLKRQREYSTFVAQVDKSKLAQVIYLR